MIQLSSVWDVRKFINLSNYLVELLVLTIRQRFSVGFLSIPTMIFVLFRESRRKGYPGIKVCKVHDDRFQ